MQSDIDLVTQVRNYIQLNPSKTAYDIVQHFKPIDERKVLYILRQIFN